MNFTNEMVQRLINDIENGVIDEWNLPEYYYVAFVNHLKSGIFQGFGSTLENVSARDEAFLKELVFNAYQFGAAKTFQQTRAISDLLVDENGNVRSSRAFNKVAREMFSQWNDDWGKTEYNTAIGTADMAAKWRTIQSEKDVMKMLKYSAIIDPNTTAICRPLDGIVAPVDDPIWKKITPLNHFNCRCTLLQVNGEPTHGNEAKVNEVVSNMQPMFINNVGETGMIFPKDHPYFNVEKEFKGYAKRNFDLPIPKEVQPVEETKPNEFVPLKSIKSIEEKLQSFGIEKVSLRGLTLENSNAVLEAMTTEFERNGLTNTLKQLTTSKACGKSARADYQRLNRRIRLNINIIQNNVTGKKKIVDEIDRIIGVKERTIARFGAEHKESIRMSRLVDETVASLRRRIADGKEFFPFSISDEQESVYAAIKATVHHEFGHHIHYIDYGMNESIFESSEKLLCTEYSGTNKREYFAEWFSYYRRYGEKGVPDDILQLFKKSDKKWK